MADRKKQTSKEILYRTDVGQVFGEKTDSQLVCSVELSSRKAGAMIAG